MSKVGGDKLTFLYMPFQADPIDKNISPFAQIIAAQQLDSQSNLSRVGGHNSSDFAAVSPLFAKPHFTTIRTFYQA